MALLAVQHTGGLTGAVESLAAADPAGDSFANDGHTILRVKNASAAGTAYVLTVTIVATKACSHGFTHTSTVTVAAGVTKDIGPFPPSIFNEDGEVAVAYTGTHAADDITVAAVSLASA